MEGFSNMAYFEFKINNELCKKFRQEQLKVTQKDVAEELNFSQENISAFENGRNGNVVIFMWYVKNGLFDYYSIDEITGGVEDVERPIQRSIN